MLDVFIIVVFAGIAFVMGAIFNGRAQGSGDGSLSILALLTFFAALFAAGVLGLMLVLGVGGDRTTALRLFFACLGFILGAISQR